MIERQGMNAATEAAPVGADKLPNVPTLPYGRYLCPPSTVLGLQGKSQKQEVTDTIDSYRRGRRDGRSHRRRVGLVSVVA